MSSESFITTLGLVPKRFLSEIIFDVEFIILYDNFITWLFLLVAGESATTIAALALLK
jgi:hypothetical protein